MELQQAFAERATRDHLVQSLVGMLNAESLCTADVENKSCSDWDILQMQLKQLLQRLHEKEVEVAGESPRAPSGHLSVVLWAL